MSSSIRVQISFLGREELLLFLTIDERNHIKTAKLQGIGSLKFLNLLNRWKKKLKGNYMEIPIPQGNEPEEMILREALLKMKGKWDYPYKKETLCYCRKVLTHKIDCAILSGAKTPEEISLLTGASTGCGTCRVHAEKILDFRLIHRKAS